MNDENEPKDVLYFISDAHLGPNLPYPEYREAWLINWLKEIHNDACQLFIVGDLFDFWIEYGRVIRSEYFNVLSTLADLVEGGTQVHYIAGNHDFALGPFLEDHVGIHVHDNALRTTIAGLRFYITHGDGLIPADKGYRVLKKCLRHPTLQSLYKLLHPSMGIGMATLFSKLSRRNETDNGPKFGHQEYRKIAWDITEQGYDIVIMGHTHHPEIIHRQNKIYCNTGDWIKSFTYASFHTGTLRLYRYRDRERPKLLSPIIENHSG